MARTRRRRRRRRLHIPSWLRIGGLSPWDRGTLEAHWMHSVPTHKLRERLERVRRRRRGLFARLWPPRRMYLEALMRGIEWEIDRRGGGGQGATRPDEQERSDERAIREGAPSGQERDP